MVVDRRHREQGFVLVLALAVLAVAAAAMVCAVRRSLQQALASNQAERQLQQRWARIGLQRFLGDRAERVLAREADPSTPWRAELAIELAGARYRVVMADEQAKLNVNSLLLRRGGAGLQEALRDVQASASVFLRVALRPSASAGAGQPAGFETFGQLFELSGSGPDQLVGPSGSSGPADAITLWGDGKLNVLRASDLALRIWLVDVLTEEQIAKLADMRRTASVLPVATIVRELGLSEETAELLVTIVTDESRCHSVWVLPDSNDETAARSLQVRFGEPGRDRAVAPEATASDGASPGAAAPSAAAPNAAAPNAAAPNAAAPNAVAPNAAAPKGSAQFRTMTW